MKVCIKAGYTCAFEGNFWCDFSYSQGDSDIVYIELSISTELTPSLLNIVTTVHSNIHVSERMCPSRSKCFKEALTDFKAI